ncbi:MAG: hypothetical protein HXS54_17750 [Theionarchaea archaeon]|nr:hypothetical protein [Theionarchaea archaeon]
MPPYSGKLINHFQNPRNGLIQNSEGKEKLSCDVWGYHAPAPVKKRTEDLNVLFIQAAGCLRLEITEVLRRYHEV